jgi:hypothetical protein
VVRWKAVEGCVTWTQGLQEREDIPARFLAWADDQGATRGWGSLEYITWFDAEPNVLILDYGDRGTLKVSFGND